MFLEGANNSKFAFVSSTSAGDDGITIAPSSSGANDSFDWNRSLRIQDTGELNKRIDGNHKTAFSVSLWNNNSGVGNTFKVLGDGRTTIGLADDNTDLEIPDGYMLYVKDGILTEKVKVALHNDPANWADYVFDEDYQLMPLNQLKTYVTENHHLPNIPSSQELIDNGGVELMEMTKLQMEKIEELTLYMIQMNERMEKLEKENESLKKRLKRRKR
jgi:hypothetical protein